MQIFPYVFGRIGGASFKIVRLFENSSLEEYVNKIDEHYLKMDEIKNEIIGRLFDKVRIDKSSKNQNLLLNLKRDVYNNRNISQFLIHDLILCDKRLYENLQTYIYLQDQIKREELKFDEIYCTSIINSVNRLKDISKQYFLRNGLIFSSTSIYQNLDKFSSELCNNKLGDKKQMRMALALFQYLTRSAAKTSPFSSYNSIFALKEKGNYFHPVNIKSNRSKLSINNIFYLLLETILRSIPSINRNFKAYINPTIKIVNERIEYFQSNNNNEAFCSVHKSNILSFIINFFQEKQDITYNDLYEEIKNVTDESPEHIAAYLNQLIDKGLIIIQLPVFIKERDWTSKLRSNLINYKFSNEAQEIIESLIHLLDNLNLTVRQIEGNYSVNERENIIDQTYQKAVNTIKLISQKAGLKNIDNILVKLSPSNLFYEDTLTDSISSIDVQLFKEQFTKIFQLNQFLQKNCFKTEIKKEFAKKIKEMYDSKKVPLLEFYCNVYLKNKSFETTLFNYQNNLYNAFKFFFQSIQSKTVNDKLDLMDYFKNEAFDEISSLDLFAQIGDNNTIVVNNILSGATTNTSRFISLFIEDSIDTEIKNKFKELYNGKIVSELVDASIHNANTFPCLTDYVIDVSLKTSEYQTNINFNGLYICLNDRDEVIIENEQGMQVVPIDFSMESIIRKASLMRFIDIFNDANSEGISIFLQIYEKIILSNKISNIEPAIVIPRLYYSNNIILSRKKWLVTKAFLNEMFFAKSTESLQFLAFNKWRKKLKIPDHIFVKPNIQIQTQKPQYINLNSPLSFNLFKNLLVKIDDLVEISEMLPAPEHLYKNEQGESYVIEYIFSLLQN